MGPQHGDLPGLSFGDVDVNDEEGGGVGVAVIVFVVVPLRQ